MQGPFEGVVGGGGVSKLSGSEQFSRNVAWHLIYGIL